MQETLTIRLDSQLQRLLNLTVERTGRKKSDLAREAIRRQLSIFLFEKLRDRTIPFAEAQGLLTDEDVFRKIS